jgi:RimK family alpha-L-glutamate ligase
MEKFFPALPFNQYLNESKEENQIEILILSGDSKGSKTSKSFEDECQKRDIPCHVVDINVVTLEKVYNGHVLRTGTGDDIKEILIRPETTAIVPRRGVISNTHTKDIMRELESSRYFCLNSLESIEVCESKFLTSRFLEKENLPVPRYALVTSDDNLDSALESVGGQFPIVMKLLSGTQGIGVSIVDSYASLKSVYQTIQKLNPDGEVLLQEKIDSNFDIRVQVIVKRFDPLNQSKDNCQILGAMKREAVEKDFRTNYSLGGKVSAFEIDDEIEKIACEAANAVSCHWCGVDIMIDSKTNKPYILEVNSSPGTEGISEAIGKPIVDDVIDFIVDKNNWTYTKLEIGYLETIEIPEIGTMVAKFDTGNGSTASSIHADSVEESDGVVKWSVGNKIFENPIVGYTKTEVGRDTEERPIIEMDILFNGVKIPGVKVAPTDRELKSTPFLANRKLMKTLGVMVNPHKAFVISQKPKDYAPMKAKGESYAGIEFSEPAVNFEPPMGRSIRYIDDQK